MFPLILPENDPLTLTFFPLNVLLPEKRPETFPSSLTEPETDKPMLNVCPPADSRYVTPPESVPLFTVTEPDATPLAVLDEPE